MMGWTGLLYNLGDISILVFAPFPARSPIESRIDVPDSPALIFSGFVNLPLIVTYSFCSETSKPHILAMFIDIRSSKQKATFLSSNCVSENADSNMAL